MFKFFKKKLELKKEEPKLEIKKNIKSIITNLVELRKLCLLVEKNEDIKEIIQTLKDTLNIYSKKAIGLSANQIGYNKKIAYIRIPISIDKDKKIQYNEYILINPKIIEKDKPVKILDEGCLSFPGIKVITKRYIFITIEYLNEKFESQIMAYQDWEALAIQHEIDHLNGLTIFDRKWRAK